MEPALFADWNYVVKRGKNYSVRVPVPSALRETLGKNEITKTLGTSDDVKAKKRYHEVLAELEAKFEAARNTLKPPELRFLSVDEAQRLADSHFVEVAYESEALAYRVFHADGAVDVGDETLVDQSDLKLEIQLDLKDAHTDGENYAKPIADRILIAAAFPVILEDRKVAGRTSRKLAPKKIVLVDRTSDGYRHLVRRTHKSQIEIWERMLAILRGEVTVYRPEPSALLSGHPQQVAGVAQGNHQAEPYPHTVSQILEAFFKTMPRKNERWEKDIRTAFRPAFELWGEDRRASSLVKDDFRELLAFFRKLPRQIGNSKRRWKGLTLKEIVAQQEVKPDFEDDLLGPKTVNKYMGRVRQVFAFAEEEPLIERNHANGVKIHADEIEDLPGRQPFSFVQLQTIFSQERYLNPDVSKPSEYWPALIALFHGMRSEEILQLRASDFQTDEKGTWYIDIHRRDGNSLKNQSSVRTVPVHPIMERFNLASLVETASNRDGGYLMHDLNRGSEGRFTPVFSRRFSRHLENIGAKTKLTSFHSFRHNFRDAARDCDMSEGMVCALGGWTFEKGVHAQYGIGYQMLKKASAMGQITFPMETMEGVATAEW